MSDADRYMARADFDDNFAAIAAEVLTLARRRKARIVACRSDHGELLAEVIGTTFGLVVRYRDGSGDLNRNADSYMPFRHGGWTLDPFTGDRSQLFEAFGRRSGIYGLFGSYFIDRIAAGDREFTARRPDRAEGSHSGA
jgi:hypothetical protein